ncbi:MAG: glycosyltransferase [Bacteroidia bacterium]|nr:glycosyltransferase [Bacteroidia bacterium]
MILGLYWLALAIGRAYDSNAPAQSVSILIPAHNAERTIPFLLQSLAHQIYEADIEIIVALDRCTDATRAVVESYRSLLSLKVIEISTVPSFWTPKKYALWRAAQLASHPWCIVIDADVMVQPDWLKGMMKQAHYGKYAVIGYAWLFGNGSIFSELAAYEAALVQLESIGRAKWGFPYMSTGRGWAVRRAWLLTGLYAWREVISGDDDLTLQLLPRSSIAVGPVCSWSSAPTTFTTAYLRKWRHLQTARYYGRTLRLSLAAVPFLQLMLFFLSPYAPWILVIVPAAKFIALGLIRAPKAYNALWADWLLVFLQGLYPLGVMWVRRDW